MTRSLILAAALLAARCASAPARPHLEPDPPSRPQRITVAPPATRLDRPDRDASPGGASSTAGIMHTLIPGQTLYSIARAYQVPLDTLLRVNGIADPRSVPDGKALFIPGASRPLDVPATFTPTAPRARHRPRGPTTEAAEPQEASMLGLPGGTLSRPVVEAPGLDEDRSGLRAPSSLDLAWPLRGTITSRFGPRGRHAHHEGVDIDGVVGEEILAAAAGEVVRADREGGYGRVVVIDHGGGITSLYAHASRILVHEGDRVEAGEAIAEVGRSGNARGSHLHFELHRDGRPIDPLPLLRNGAVSAGDDR